MGIPLTLVAFGVTRLLPQQEEKLLSAFQRLSRDDISALEDIYDLCANDVYGLALWKTGSAEDASDIVQEVFLKLARKREWLGSISKPRSYILQITQRLGIDLYRSRKRRRTHEMAVDFFETSFIDEQLDPEERLQLHNAIAKLNPKQREVLYLRFFMGLSFSQIADVCDVHLFTAAGRCRLAVEKLRVLLTSKR